MPGGDPAGRARRYERVLWLLVVGANYFGITLTILYAYFAILIYPDDRRSAGRLVLELSLALLPLIVAASLVGMAQARRRVTPATRWLTENRTPSPEENVALYALPRRLANLGFGWWLLAIAILVPYSLFVVGYDLTPDGVVRSVLAILLISIAPWSLSYLFVERALRPVYAAAFSEDAELPKTMGLPARLMLAWMGTSGLPIIGVLLVLVAQTDVRRERAIPAVFMICAAGTVAGIAVAVFSGRAIIDPLTKVRSALREVGRGNLDLHVPVSEAAELGELQAGVNRMVAGLRDRDRLREIFGHHVGPDVAQRAMDGDIALGGELVEATAMFVDVIASSALAEDREPDEVVGMLNAFFDSVVRCVGAEGGYVSKFEGDGALCVFGAPVVVADHAERALRAARALRLELRSLSEALDAAIGISSGEVVAGNIGAANRYEYTIIGDAVNETSRLTDEAKNRHTRVLASERTLAHCGLEAAHWGHSGTIHLRGRARPTVAFEPGLT